MQAEPSGWVTAAIGSVRATNRDEITRQPAWQRCCANRRKDRRYYEIVADTLGAGFGHGYFVLHGSTGDAAAVQPFFVVDQDLLLGAGKPFRWLAAQVRRLFPQFLFLHTLMIGCAAGEGHLDSPDPDDAGWIITSLEPMLRDYAKRIRAPLVVFKEFPSQYRSAMRPLVLDGYTRVPSLPMTRLNICYASFDEYLAKGVSKATRKDLRRKFKAAGRAPPLEMSVVNDITPYADEAYPLYLAVHQRSKLRFEKLTKQYFCRLGRDMPEVTRFFLWRQQGKLVAFGMCMLEGDTIYDECIGLDYSIALDLHLYFLTLRDVLTWAIEGGYKWYCSSSLGYDPKLHLGSELLPLDLYVTHTSRPINFVLRRLLPLLEPTRGDKTLRKFRNYSALRENT
jgi:hypothetical protein